MTDCPNCNGAGTIRAETTDRGEDDYEYDADCPACCGTGSADLADAINALPYSLHRVRPGVEVVSKAEVLAIIKARAALAAPAVPPKPLGYITPHARKFLRGCKSQKANTHTSIYRHRQDDTDVPIYTAPPVKDSLTAAPVAAAPDAQKGEP